MRIGVIGAGHAGVEAASAARQAGAEVTLFSNESVPPYFRPRLPSLAFGHVGVNQILIHPADWYTARGIDLRLSAHVVSFDAASRRVVTDRGSEAFDALVVTTGASAVTPRLEGSDASMPVLPLWSVADAQAILACSAAGRRLTVVGGGILGLETALRGREAGLTVTIVERMPRLMPVQFGPAASSALASILATEGITVKRSCSIRRIDRNGASLVLAVEEGDPIETDLVVLAIGARPRHELTAAAGLAVSAGIVVDGNLRTSNQRVFAAGDVAQFGKAVRCSVREAVAQGKVAGFNAAAALTGAPLLSHIVKSVPVTFKSRELELASVGRVEGEGCTEERLDDGRREAVYAGVVRCQGTLVGVQMVGTRERFDELAAAIP